MWLHAEVQLQCDVLSVLKQTGLRLLTLLKHVSLLD
jgi:hypothetical protein